MTRKGLSAWLVFALLTFAAQPLLAASGQTGDQSQQPATEIKLSDAIRSEVVEVTQLYLQKQSKNGLFQVRDSVSNTDIQLNYQDLPKSQVEMLAPDLFVSEGDFETPDGKHYTLNFWVQGKDRSAMKVTKTMIYEANGKKRYSWEKQGIYVRQKAVPR